jgi:hypothetical protein
MMSDMEENAQIGDFISQRQAQKKTLEHLNVKSKRIAAAYSAFAAAQDRWRVDDTTGRGNVFLLHPIGDERNHPQYLLGQSELADHIREIVEAEKALAETQAQLERLGITD